ncbi:VOC family protein [candidate division KSB1 bacterium]|nr:VOC family protein [candidate division KSB1 bacterium]NIR71417.1 VOC family protein [candidate division KSB1 bacterium]NIS23338.1 VOC family protein [candidate division KSB1 bacterium]NIT70229.1 VOC family protein [candidate division KSB1 bacterium]NIU23952.1 VOC family protein [candidate division KSB1 bacterium]
MRSGSTYVTGIGGVFFKVNDPEQFRAWYKKHLGIRASASGANFFWRKSDDPQSFARTVWTPFPQNSDYFGPGAQQIMINYRVRELDALLNKLTAAGVEQVGKVEEYWYGRFAWIIDGEGNRVELWEPVDLSPDEFERRLEQQQKQRDE